MRVRNAIAAGTAVSLLSVATTLMATATASAGATQAATTAPVAHISTTSAGSPEGLILGLLAVLGMAAVSFSIRIRATRRTPARVISIPAATVVRHAVPAYAQ